MPDMVRLIALTAGALLMALAIFWPRQAPPQKTMRTYDLFASSDTHKRRVVQWESSTKRAEALLMPPNQPWLAVNAITGQKYLGSVAISSDVPFNDTLFWTPTEPH